MKVQRSGKSRQRQCKKSLRCCTYVRMYVCVCACVSGNWKVTDWSGKRLSLKRKKFESKMKEYCEKGMKISFKIHAWIQRPKSASVADGSGLPTHWEQAGCVCVIWVGFGVWLSYKSSGCSASGLGVCCRAHFLAVNIAGWTKPL